MRPLLRSVETLEGWRRNAVAFALGMLLTLTLAPFYAFPLIVPAFGGLYLLISHADSRKRIFWDGWWWGWGHHITGLYWICIALFTDAEKFAWLLPFTLFGLTGVVAVYAGIACWLASYAPLRSLRGIWVFAAMWALAEYARGHLFTGFPWNLAGYGFAATDASLQMAALAGIYGLTWFAALLGALPAALAIRQIPLKQAAMAVGFAYVLFFAGSGWGAWRLHQAAQLPEAARYVEGVRLRLVQANIPQNRKWDPEYQLQGLQKNIRLTHAPGLENITHIVWPETAIPFFINADRTHAAQLGSVIPPRALLISGGLRAEREDGGWKVWNSVVALNHEGEVLGAYDKALLVPFGEFVPFRAFLSPLGLTPAGEKDFAAGSGPQLLSWGGINVSPLICYESIFPEYAAFRPRPQLLLSVTNDAWFGNSTGPYQHFDMARMRAVEQGVPLLQVGNTGITGITDSYGKVLSSLGLGEEGILDVKLPKISDNTTPYGSYGDGILLLVITAVLGALIIRIKKTRNN